MSGKNCRGFGLLLAAKQIRADAQERFGLAEQSGARSIAVDDTDARAAGQVVQECKQLASRAREA